jgi:hypothetical protein
MDLHLTNCTFDNVAEGNIVKNVKDATLSNVKMNGKTVTTDNADLNPDLNPCYPWLH